jgi:hypothetical protein
VAEKSEQQITEATADRVERITLAMANGEAISEEDALWIADFNEKQAVIQSALTDGRRIEEEPIHLDDGRTVVQWTEFLPLPGGEVVIRMGADIITDGIFGTEISRTASYYNPNDPMRIGMIESVISGGEERLTGITDFSEDGVFGGMKVGDTRPSLIPSFGLAGERPQSWDPGSGKLGIASGGSHNPSDSTSSSTDLQSDRMGTGPLDPTDQPDSTESPSESGSDGGDPMGDTVDPDPGTEGGSDGGDPMGDTVDPDPGTEGGSDGGDPSSGQTTDQPPPTESSQESTGPIEDEGFTVEGEFEHVENVNTGQVGAEYESGDIEVVGGTVAPVAGHWESTERRDPELELATGGAAIPQHEAPIDYGDAADPNYDPVIPTKDEILSVHGDNPLILVDPSSYEASTTGLITEPEVVSELENYGNPLEENQSLAPGGGMPNTGEQEYIGGDELAASSPGMAESAEEEGPNQEGLGDMGGDDPLR